MTENPNIKKEILEWCLKQNNFDKPFDMTQFATEKGYSEKRVCIKVSELSPLLEYGVSPKYPWIAYKKLPEIKEQLEKYQ